MTQITFPASTNDDGTLTTGTVLNEAFFDAIESGINALVHSSSNPAITPVNIIDEVVTARGSKASLDARLDVEHNDDGTHNLSANIVTTSVLAASLAGQNLAANPTFIMWPDGDTSAPAYYSLSGAGATIARTGTGLGDTTRLIGDFCAFVTYGSATARLQQTLLDAGVWPANDHLEGEKIAYSVWVKSSTVAKVRAFVYTGTAGYEYSSYHTGGGSWERLEVVETILATATELSVGVEISGTGNFYMSGPCPMLSNTAPTRFVNSQAQRGSIVWSFSGSPPTGDGQRHFIPSRVIKLTDVQIYAKTAPSGGAFTIDIERGDGSTWVSVLAATMSVDDGKEFAWQEVDTGTYARKFVEPAFVDNGDNGDAGATNSVLRLNIDAVNGAADITIIVRGWQYARLLEDALAYND
jgi:hypothetical protein